MKLIHQRLWIHEVAEVFAAAGVSSPDTAASFLARELDEAGLTETWEDDPAAAAQRQIEEWDSHADEAAQL